MAMVAGLSILKTRGVDIYQLFWKYFKILTNAMAISEYHCLYPYTKTSPFSENNQNEFLLLTNK